jgi:hypothetical protein
VTTSPLDRRFVAVGLTLVVLSLATMIWYLVRDENVGAYPYAALTAGVLIAALGLFLGRRR